MAFVVPFVVPPLGGFGVTFVVPPSGGFGVTRNEGNWVRWFENKARLTKEGLSCSLPATRGLVYWGYVLKVEL